MYHFIAGYPRSGSTLLAALLRQNPRFHASIISPLGQLTQRLQEEYSPTSETHVFFTEKQRRDLFSAVFNSYYMDEFKDVVFDTSRRWAACAEVIRECFPGSYIICCVRPVREVLNSFERVFRNNMMASTIFGCSVGSTVYQRMDVLMAPNGVVGYALQAMAQAWSSPSRDRLIVVEYKDLVADPQGVMDYIHTHIEEDRFVYDAEHLEQIPGAEEFDKTIGCPGLHRIEPAIHAPFAENYLPPDVLPNPVTPFWH